MTSSSRTTTRSNISAAPAARPAICNGQIQDGGNPFEGPRSRPYPNPPQKQGFGHTLWAKAATRDRLQAVPAAVRQHVAGLHQSARRAHGALHLLRLLRVVRLRQLFQGEPADHDPAGADPQIEFRGARPVRGDAHQPRRLRQARDRRHLSSTPAATNGSSRPTSCILCRLFAVQRAAAAAVGDRQALRPCRQQGRDRPQLHAPDACRASTAFSTRASSTSIRSSPPARSACASTSSTATISITARSASSAAAISARCRPTAARSRPRRCRRTRRNGARSGRRRSPTITSATSRAAASTAACYSYRDVYLDLDPTYKDRFGRPLMRMTIDFHDNELKMPPIMTDKYAEIVKAMGAAAGREEAAQGALRRHQLSDDASQRRRDHGRRSARPARSTAICRAGTCRTCS